MPTKAQLAENLLLIAQTLDPGEDPDNSHRLAKYLKMPQRTVYNLLIAKAGYKSLDKLSARLKMPSWQLIFPIRDKVMLDFLKAYNEADEAGRLVFEIAIDGVQARIAKEQQRKDNEAAS